MTDRPTPGVSDDPNTLRGIAGSPGVAVGRAVVVDTRRPGVPRRHVSRHQAELEVARFDAAVRVASAEFRTTATESRGRLGRAEASILEAYVLMVEDEMLRTTVERAIQLDLKCAEWAVDGAVHELAEQLRASQDAYLAERSHDFEFVGDRLLRALMHRQHAVPVLAAMDTSGIIVTHDLSPAETAGLSKDRVRAIVTEVGTRTSHTAILARALEIPAVVGVRGAVERVANGETLLVDGHRGLVFLNPDAGLREEALERGRRHEVLAEELREDIAKAVTTRCGQPVVLRANIELPSEAELAMKSGARGIGLYRTEFLYISRPEPPSEDEQYGIYRHVIERVTPHPTTLRTFDLGGDKFASALLTPPEMNPALGLRAVRLALSRPALFGTQLRAMVRASAHGPVQIMVPMISGVEELREVKVHLEAAIAEVDRRGQARAEALPLGAMVEIPSAAILAAELAAEAAFLSIGTNDLMQYALAVDRTNQDLAPLASPFHPALLRLIDMVVRAASSQKIPVSVCGAMASDVWSAALLVGLGLRELSLESTSIPEVRAAIGRIDCAEAREIAADVVRSATALEAETRLKAAYGDRFEDLIS